jgi:predicted nucleic acid-binding protein
MTAQESGPSFLDTSMIIRYLTVDIPELFERAVRIIDAPDRLLLTHGTLTESAFVLTKIYELPRDAAVDALVMFVQRQNVQVYELDKGLVIQALLLCRPSGRVSFADAMLWAVACSASSRSVVFSFDRRVPTIGIQVGDTR